MKHQTYDLKDLDESTRQSIVRNEVDSLIEGQTCSICDGAFISRQEKDNAIVSGTHPLIFAHSFCWQSTSPGRSVLQFSIEE